MYDEIHIFYDAIKIIKIAIISTKLLPSLPIWPSQVLPTLETFQNTIHSKS